MIDPDDIVNHAATVPELEEQILFWVAAAGKDAFATARALDRFLGTRGRRVRHSPFGRVRRVPEPELPGRLRACGFGCFNQRAASFRWLARAGLDLRACEVDDLIRCPGINFKTAKGFLLYTRPGAVHVVADRHFFAYMRERGCGDCPKDSPQTLRRYEHWERKGLAEAARLGLSALEFDRLFWRARRRGPARDARGPEAPHRDRAARAVPAAAAGP